MKGKTMYIDIPPFELDHWQDPYWQHFTITPQDFHRHWRYTERLIIDSPEINAAFADYQLKGKLYFVVPYEAGDIPIIMMFDYISGLRVHRCVLNDAELEMLLLLRWPRLRKDADLLQTIMQCSRDAEYRNHGSKLSPYIDIPQPYKDILYREYADAEPWEPIHIIDPAAV
jgi:hypothetical protein